MLKLSDSLEIGPVPFDQFRESVTGYSLYDALQYMQWIGCRLKNQIWRKIEIRKEILPSSTGHFFLIGTEANAFISKWLLSCSSEIFGDHYRARDHAKSTILFHHLDVDLAYYSSDNPDIYKALIRAANTQFHYQRIPGYLAGRYLSLFSPEIGAESLGYCVEGIDLHARTILTIGLICFGHLLRHGILSLQALLDENQSLASLRRILTRPNLEAFLDMFTANVQEIRELTRTNHGQFSPLPVEKYEFNPLWSFPFVKVQPDLARGMDLVVPSVPDLAYACTEGIYYKLMDLFRGKGKRNRFSTSFGTTFRNYVEYVLSDTPNPPVDLDEGDSNSTARPDFLVDESPKTLIEVKKRVMPNAARIARGNALESYIDSVSNDIYRQLFRPWVANGCMSQCMLVSLDEWYYFEEHIKGRIEERLKRLASHEESVNLERFRFHLLGCTDFELLSHFLTVNGHVKLGTLLEKKSAGAYYYASMDKYLTDAMAFKYRNEDTLPMRLFRQYSEELQSC